MLSITPAMSYRLLPQLSIGIEFIIGYGKSEIQLPLGDLCLETKTDGFGFGASLGLLYEPNKKLSLGLSWRSPMKTPLEGDAHLNGAKDGVKLDLYWPQMLTGGIAYEITPGLKTGISLKWTDWSVLDRSEFGYDTFSFLDGHLLQDTRDGIKFQAGLEYFHRKNFVLRCGYMYDRSSIDNKWNSPIFFDSDSHQIAVGSSYKIRNFWIDFAYVHAFMKNRRIPDSMTGFSGEYTSSMEIFSLDVRCCY